MGLYNVVKPCVVGLLHYVRPTAAPIEVDDDVAAPLVAAGDLSPYRGQAWVEKLKPDTFKEAGEFRFPHEVAEKIPPVIPKPRTRRKAAEG